MRGKRWRRLDHMLGRSVTSHYRADLNFLSRADYSRVGVHYTTNQVVPIVRLVAITYDPHRTHVANRNHLERGATTMNIVAMVLAGGEGTRLYPLTAEHAKPA